nr:indole-3-glycerol phosphate synthase TrpC [Evansella caseinilytica]
MLDTIVAHKKQEIQSLPVREKLDFPKRSLYDAMQFPKRSMGIIAEIKKASPSKGVLSTDFQPLEIADTYEKLNVDAISVLTDERFFQGRASYLTEVKHHTNLPVLRKDFIIDEAQISESKIIGADAILLIAAILEKSQLQEFYKAAEEQNLDVLVEVHNEQELENVLSVLFPKMIGVNNRDLNTFRTSLSTSRRLAEMIPEGILFVSESGIKTREDIDYLKRTRANGLLVGEAFMAADDKRGVLSAWFDED